MRTSADFPRSTIAAPPRATGSTMTHWLLVCGILSAVLYAAMLLFVPVLWEGYSSASQTVSELSAMGAPTRAPWVGLGTVWALLYVAFGWGVWRSAGHRRSLRVVGAAILAGGILSLYWPPMHLRGTELTLTDMLHIVWTVATGILFLVAMGFGSAAFGRGFRLYSFATMLILLGAGAMTSMDAPRVAADLPTPWMGLWERINIAAWLLWMTVLAAMLLRRQAPPSSAPEQP